MAIIAYQSLNANSSSTHDFKSMSFQRFTKDANKNSRKRDRDILEYPIDPFNLADPIEGPANKRRIADLQNTQHTVSVFGGHVSQVWQHLVREFGGMPDLMVIGEMDSSHQDFESFVSGNNMIVDSFPNKKACQFFSAICQKPQGSQLKSVTSGAGYVVYSVHDFNFVFVHVPNEFTTDAPNLKNFYTKIAQELNGGGKVIHAVLGDTNQKRTGFTADVLNAAFGVTAYQTASPLALLVDTYPPLTIGTNSTGKEMYDVAVYRSDLLDLKKVAYISQSPTSVTVTDHCGLGIHIVAKTTH